MDLQSFGTSKLPFLSKLINYMYLKTISFPTFKLPACTKNVS